MAFTLRDWNRDNAWGSLGYAKDVAAMVVAIDAGGQHVHVAIGRTVETARICLFYQFRRTAFEFGSIVTIDLIVVTAPSGSVADALQIDSTFANHSKVTIHQTLDHFLGAHQFGSHENRKVVAVSIAQCRLLTDDLHADSSEQTYQNSS